MTRRLLLFLLFGLLCAQEPAHSPVKFESPVQDKNFYLLSMMERTPAVRAAIREDSVLARVTASRRGGAGLEAFRWTDEQAGMAAPDARDRQPLKAAPGPSACAAAER